MKLSAAGALAAAGAWLLDRNRALAPAVLALFNIAKKKRQMQRAKR